MGLISKVAQSTLIKDISRSLALKLNIFLNIGDKNKIKKGKRVKLKGFCFGNENKIVLKENIQRKNLIEINVEGDNNEITLEEESFGKNSLKFSVHGNNNKIHIGKSFNCLGLNVEIGSKTAQINNAELNIEDKFTCCKDVNIIAAEQNIPIKIGKDCMFSNSITIRSGESPHVIFNKDTGKSFDRSRGVYIGNHVWIGEKVIMLKNASIADDSIVGAASVVTKKFEDKNVVIAGNPAKIVKKNINWARASIK